MAKNPFPPLRATRTSFSPIRMARTNAPRTGWPRKFTTRPTMTLRTRRPGCDSWACAAATIPPSRANPASTATTRDNLNLTSEYSLDMERFLSQKRLLGQHLSFGYPGRRRSPGRRQETLGRVAAGDLKPDAFSVADLGLFLQPEIYRLTKHYCHFHPGGNLPFPSISTMDDRGCGSTPIILTGIDTVSNSFPVITMAGGVTIFGEPRCPRVEGWCALIAV